MKATEPQIKALKESIKHWEVLSVSDYPDFPNADGCACCLLTRENEYREHCCSNCPIYELNNDYEHCEGTPFYGAAGSWESPITGSKVQLFLFRKYAKKEITFLKEVLKKVTS